MFPKAEILILTIVLTMTSFSATAMPPTKGVFAPIEQEGFFIADCGSFQVLSDFVVVIEFADHYDKQGELIFTNYRLWSGDVTYYNSTDPSISVIEKQGNREITRWYWQDGWLADLGNFFKITLPGQGVVFHQTGLALLSLDTFEIFFSAGPHDYSDENVAAVCAAFAG